MMKVVIATTIKHFTQANPPGAGQQDVPALLRRVAPSIEEFGQIDVQDIVFHEDVEDTGDNWPSMTVYFYDFDDSAADAQSLSDARSMRRKT